jgi:hypothetical protein
MESFVLIVGGGDVPQLRGKAAAALRAVTPRAGAGLLEQAYDLPEVNGALVCVMPDAPDFRSLIDVHESDARLVVVFGKLTGEPRPARVIHDLAERSADWQAQARSLDGVFFAVVVDRRARSVVVLSDVIGCRAPLWQARDGVLLISPHALGMIGTGLVPLAWDACAIASSSCVDWSLGRAPLLEGLRTLQAFETLRWSDGAAHVDVASPIAFEDRIHRLNVAALAAQDGAMVEAMVRAASAFAREHDGPIAVSLTRGLDSRAVLGFLHAAGLGERLRAQTSGQPGSLDVEGAQRLAEICGVPHQRNEPPPASSDDFLWNTRLTAFLTNGDANAKQSLAKRPGLAQAGSVGGGGGEIYTGMYYPLFAPFGHVPDDPTRVADIFMTRARKGRWDALGAWSSPLRRAAQARLERSLTRFRDFGARGADLVDLLYLWERYAHWGAVTYRRPWSHGWTPFATGEAVRGLFRYPRAAGKHCNVHGRVIRDHLPLRAYLMPVNGTTLLPLRGRGEAAYMLRQAQLALSMVEKKIVAHTRKQVSDAGVEQIWARMFAEDVYDAIHAMLSDPRSAAIATFGAKSISGLLERHRRDRSQLQPLGALVMIEQFRLLAEQARAAAT